MRFYIFASLEPKPDWKSWFIMKATHSDYSHVGIIVDDTIYHAIGEGVCKEPVGEFLKRHEFKYKIEITNRVLKSDEAIGWLKGNLGKDYSETQFIGFPFKFLRRFFSDGNRELICTEYAARFLNDYTDIQAFKTLNTEFLEPDEFMAILLSCLDKEPA